MPIRREDLDRIAELARLEIPDARRERLTAELSRILDFFAALDRLDLQGVAPTTFAPPAGALRPDRPNGRRLASAEALAETPEAEEGFVVVPPIVENLNP